MSQQKTKEEYKLERPVVIDQKESVISCKVSFNTEKGTVRITPALTTKQMSFNPVQMEAAKNTAQALIDEAYKLALELLEAWVADQRPDADPAQMNIFDIINDKRHPAADKDDEIEEENEGEPALSVGF